MTKVTIAVADLVQFCHRKGDIDHRFTPSPTGAQGIAGHRRLQSKRHASYASEHAVEYTHYSEDIELNLRGRADGFDGTNGFLEEIKTCRIAPAAIPPHIKVLHFAQAITYAAMIATRDDLTGLKVQVTWLNIDTDEEYCETLEQSRAQLDNFLQTTLERFSEWLKFIASLRQKRDASIATLTLPYGDFRIGQREMAELTYKCIDQQGQLLMQAPTGIGKTVAVLFPALQALRTGKHDKIIFITARTVGRYAAQDTLADMSRAGYRGSALSLSAKDSICLSPGKACHADDCPYARGYYDKLPAALQAALTTQNLRHEEVELIAREHEVCPYTLSMDLLPWVDLVIADIHYLYGLTGNLVGNESKGSDPAKALQTTVLIDEAHNLPARARGMYSASLRKCDLMQAKKELAGDPARALQRVNRELLSLQKLAWQASDYHSLEELPTPLLHALREFSATIAAQLNAEPAFLQQHRVAQDFFFDVLQFLRVADQWGDDYRFELHRDSGKQSLVVTLNCLDAARLLRKKHEAVHATIAFSATLTPLNWSRAALGFKQDTAYHNAASPFATEQLQVSLATSVDTRYRQREQSLPQLVALLRRWLDDNPGNCIVYFPSYRYLEDALTLLDAQHDLADRKLWVQQRDQSQADKDALLNSFEERTDLAAFCILGGIFGEGIDLPGNKLSSVVIVGLGMPQVNRATRQLQTYYDRLCGSGFEYTFLYPGMQKVAQALGRVVRSVDDRGTALLIDPRYGERRYQALLPPWWNYDQSS